jgi:sulfate/thiosulfate transport system ATP-binding protein
VSIEVLKLRKTFGSFVALDDVSLAIPTGELIALLGPSGSGKTTLLRIIAGLETPDAGQVLFDQEEATHRSASERKVGIVFQHYALFKHMTVFENIAFGLRNRPRKIRPPEDQIRIKVRDLLNLIQLDSLGDRYPSQLSGGQRQRVALARTLAVEPRVLLLDEPFGALDAKIREELRKWLRHLHEQLKITSILVTHDQEEALEVADRVVVLNNGKIEQAGTPEEVYHNPATPFVYSFLGNVNLFRGRIENGRVYVRGVPIVLDSGSRQLTNANGKNAMVCVRPHLIEIALSPNGEASFPATVRHINAAGPKVNVELESQWGDTIYVELDENHFRDLAITRNAHVYLKPRENHVFVLPDLAHDGDAQLGQYHGAQGADTLN